MHREEHEFTISLHLVAEFDETYEGDDDGFAWRAAFEAEVQPRVVAAVFDALRAAPGWRAVAAPRGRDPAAAVDIEVRRASRR